MSTTEITHVDDLISDYVLGLLSEKATQQVSQHISRCERCRQQILKEREFLQLVRSSISAAGRPSSAQLARLMPMQHRPWPAGPGLVIARGLALALLLIIVAAGAVLPGWHDPVRVPAIAPTASNTTVAATFTPTNTVTATGSPQNSASALLILQTLTPEEAALRADPPLPAITPNPAPLLQ